MFWYYTAVWSLYRHMVCNLPVSCKSNGDRKPVVGVATDAIYSICSFQGCGLSFSTFQNRWPYQQQIQAIKLCRIIVGKTAFPLET